jgi:hypothetical protein
VGYIPQCEHCAEQEAALPMYVVLDGQRMSLRDVSRHTGIPLNRIEKRYKKRVRQRLAGVKLPPVMDTDHWVIFGRKPGLPKRRTADVVLADFYTPLIMEAIAKVLAEYPLSDADYDALSRSVRKTLRTPFPTQESEHEQPEQPEQPEQQQQQHENNECYEFFTH